MRKTALRQLEALEREERSYQRNHQSSLETIGFLGWKVVLAHYLGDLKSDEEDPGEAEARALKYESRYDHLEALFNGQIAEINTRFKEAARRLFGQLNLDFDRSPRSALSDSFVRMVNELPEQWLQWLESNLQVSRNSRVFTQIGKAALQWVVTPDNHLLQRRIREESRCCFCAFRRYIHRDMKVGWWPYDLAKALQLFYHGLIHGKRPKLVIMAPPQHGKTETGTDFIAWLAGKQPDLKTMFATYSEELGGNVNRALQRIMTSERYVATFGRLLRSNNAATDSSRWVQNSNVLEYVGHRGSFRNTTVAGQITGLGLDCGVIDDPIKGRAEASSKQILNNVWNWFCDDFFTRFSDSAGLLMIMTRWHLDDPVGRFIECFPDAKILRYPAIAEEDEEKRLKGEALFPQLKSLSLLMECKALMAQASWQSEYQQTPIVVGGDMFPIEKVELVPERPAAGEVVSAARNWDKAGTAGGGAYSSGVLMTRMRDGTFTVVDVRRGQWSALDRERVIKQTAEVDCGLYPTCKIYLEQEPGSGGKESAEASVRMLAGYSAAADRVTGAKEVRADPFAAQWQAGNVRLVRAEWNRSYLDEHEHFPAGKYKDQVDASSGAFNKIASKYRYDSTLSWVS
jgi:predicted phage terminase large subunit-like protein